MKFGQSGSVIGAWILVVAAATTITFAQSSAILEVTVVDADTAQPIPGAKVSLLVGGNSIPDIETTAFLEREISPIVPPGTQLVTIGRSDPPARAATTLETNSSGKSVFVDVSAGPHRLDASADGYIPLRRQGATSLARGGMPVNLSRGDKSGVMVRLRRAGTIAGSVRDDNDRPVGNLPVYLLNALSRNGERDFEAVQGTTTDSSGQFRLTGIAPGRYYVAAGLAPRFLSPAIQRNGYRPEFYQFSYHPGVFDANLAAYIDVGPGTRFDAVDLRVKAERPHRVQGRILGAQPAANPGLSIYGLRPFQQAGIYRRQLLMSPAISPDGRFEIIGLPAGTYSLGVRLDRAGPRPFGPGNAAVDDAYFTLELKGADLADLELRMGDATSIRGRVRTSDNSPLGVLVTSLGRLQVGFTPMSELQPVGFSVIDTADGTFSVKGISGSYRVSISLSGSNYISEVRLNREVMVDQILTVPNGFVGEVEIIVGTSGGSLTGQLVDAQSQPLKKALSGVLLEDPLRNPVGFYRQFATSSEGTFALQSIPPGTYRIYVWDVEGPAASLDTDLLARTRAHATLVQIDPRSGLSARVRVISTR